MTTSIPAEWMDAEKNVAVDLELQGRKINKQTSGKDALEATRGSFRTPRRRCPEIKHHCTVDGGFVDG